MASSASERVAALSVLGLPPGASRQQVTEAYRRLARAAHPDATGRRDAAAGDRFAAISDAYHRLATRAIEEPRPRDADPPSRPRPTSLGDLFAVDPLFMGGSRPPIVAGPVVIQPLPEGR